MRPTYLFSALCALLALAACTPAAQPAPSPAQPQAHIVMDTQYYDDRGSILEIPQIAGDGSEAAQAVNAALLERKAVYQSYIDDHTLNGATWCEVTAYPITTDRYLNIALLENTFPCYGTDGDLYAWVYDREEQREVTVEEALSLAGTTEDSLRQAVADALASGDLPLPLDEDTFSIRGFRIGADGQVSFYLQGANVDGAEGMDPWLGLYAWSSGEVTRFHETYSPEVDTFVPAALVDSMDPPLWCQWRQEGEPEGGFTPAKVPAGALAGRDELLSLLPALGLDPSDLAVTFDYSGISGEGRPCWFYSVRQGDTYLGSGERDAATGALLYTSAGGEQVQLIDGEGQVLPTRPLALWTPYAVYLGMDPSYTLEGALYDAAVFHTLEAESVAGGATLCLPQVTVVGSYEEGALTRYLCTLHETYYYDFLLQRGADIGGGSSYAVFSIEEMDGVYVLRDAAVGGDDMSPGAFFLSQGAPEELCARLDADSQAGGMEPLLQTPDTEDLFQTYLARCFSLLLTGGNGSKEAAAAAYLSALRADGPGESRYDALTEAFGPDAWDRVELSYGQTRAASLRRTGVEQATREEDPQGGALVTVTDGEIWRVDLTVDGNPAGHFSVTNAAGPWTLSRGLELDV